MRFALLGDHPDGIELARALCASNRHQVPLYWGDPAGLRQLARHGIEPRHVADLEELLVDAHLDAVIVAGRPGVRASQLRRALQSECHVLCVHPADTSPDSAYEAAMIRADTGRVLMPMLPLTLHPGVRRLKELPASPRLIELEIWSNEEALLDGPKPSVPGWDLLRFLGGEVAELSAVGVGGALTFGQPLMISGRFLNGLLFQSKYLSQQAEARLQIALVTATGRAVLAFAQGWPGPAQLTWTDEEGRPQAEAWEALDPWPALLERFEDAVDRAKTKRSCPLPQGEGPGVRGNLDPINWQDEVRALELDAAARRSAEKGRSSTLDYQEATEDASFKGTMTLLGCSLIWLTLLAVIVSRWLPWLLWLVLPVFALFLVMQALRWVVKKE